MTSARSYWKIAVYSLMVMALAVLLAIYASGELAQADEITTISEPQGATCTDPQTLDSPESGATLESDSLFSQSILEFINGTELSHATGLPDPNEHLESLTAYLNAMEMVKSSLRGRVFSESINIGDAPSIEQWLHQGAEQLLQMKYRYPEDRHLSEGLGKIYRELYEHSGNLSYLREAANSLINAEDLGIRYGIAEQSHYTHELIEALTTLNDMDQLNKYFQVILTIYPNDYEANFHYARGLAKMNDGRANAFYMKAISLRPEGNFNSIVSYGEYLLDSGKNQEALDVIERFLTFDEDYAYYPHFLKAIALEKLGYYERAKEEYSLFFRFNDFQKMSDSSGNENVPFIFERFFRPDPKYRIPGSTLQEAIQFKDQTRNMTALRPTPLCKSDDWVCKHWYYAVWTLNGEAHNGTIGMYRAVAWNIRGRTFVPRGTISCFNITNVCYNYAKDYPYTSGNFTSLYRRYYYVIETGKYVGLSEGIYDDPTAQQTFSDVFYGIVPDPASGKCVTGSLSKAGACDGKCSESSIWGYNAYTGYGVEFRAGNIVWKTVLTCKMQELQPMSSPTGGFCGKSCWYSIGALCPKQGFLGCQGCTRGLCGWHFVNGSYKFGYFGSVYGNFFWRLNY